jgi:epoxyqueuosine reductase
MSDSRAEAIRSRSHALGFHRVGIARAGALADDFARYEEFLRRGYHGAMGWLAEDRETRRDVDGPGILDGARAVVVCALSYHRGDEPSPMEGARIARYARGRDYHNFLRKRLRRLAAWMRATFGAEARPVVDTAPVLERAWARRAGVGFVGRNGCIIAPGLGSYILLGEVVTDLDLAPDEPVEERCGECRRCLDACPTDAFVASHVLDARRCVSYLTIEQPEGFPAALRGAVGDRIFGCDDCQDVCPFNRTRAPDGTTTRDFAPDPRWRELPPESWLALEDEAFRARTEGSPLARPGADGMARNAAVVLGNIGGRRHLPVLRACAATHRSAVVREAAAWAAAKIESREE